MKKIIAVLVIVSVTISYCQFDSLIFSKQFTYGESSLLWNSVLGLGDQNNDGYDDILIYECNRQMAGIYYGGSPMDTIPVIEIYISENITAFLGMLSVDINGDNFSDIMINYVANSHTYLKGFYGGPMLDTIPDLLLGRPEGASNYFAYGLEYLKDFDGSGYGTIVINDPFLPFSINN